MVPWRAFLARVWILGAFAFAFIATMVLVGGPYVPTGHVRTGGYNGSPTSFADVVGMAVGAGVIGALVWPLTGRRGGPDDLEM